MGPAQRARSATSSRAPGSARTTTTSTSLPTRTTPMPPTRRRSSTPRSTGIYVIHGIPEVDSNLVSHSGTTNSGALDRTGIDVETADAQGQVACNTLSNHDTAINYTGNAADEDPLTNDNNFVDVVSGAG